MRLNRVNIFQLVTTLVIVNESNADTQQYLSDLDNMHKVVLKSKTSDELSQLSDTLTSKVSRVQWCRLIYGRQNQFLKKKG